MSALEPIGRMITPFSQKFGIPRQGAGLSIAKGRLEFAEHIDVKEACAGIEQFSHLWILFQFHQNSDRGWSSKVRPPRLGGNNKIGVFASRSSFRPNQIGMSLVKLLSLTDEALIVSGVDMLSGTPVVDIKPYIAYADSLPDAISGYAQSSPAASLTIHYSDIAKEKLASLSVTYEDLPELIKACISSDPRPAYKQDKTDEKQYHMRLYDIDIDFSVSNSVATVHGLNKINHR
jgi:tRNA-Thr(GGU) m(6)t(6)A37 methyltransferase TsaA